MDALDGLLHLRIGPRVVAGIGIDERLPHLALERFLVAIAGQQVVAGLGAAILV